MHTCTHTLKKEGSDISVDIPKSTEGVMQKAQYKCCGRFSHPSEYMNNKKKLGYLYQPKLQNKRKEKFNVLSIF